MIKRLRPLILLVIIMSLSSVVFGEETENEGKGYSEVTYGYKNDYSNLTISPSEKILVFVNNSKLYLYDLSTNRKMLLYKLDNEEYFQKVFSRNGDILYFVDDKKLKLLNVKGVLEDKYSEPKLLTELKYQPFNMRLSDKENYLLFGSSHILGVAKGGLGLSLTRQIETVELNGIKSKIFHTRYIYENIRMYEDINRIFGMSDYNYITIDSAKGRKRRKHYTLYTKTGKKRPLFDRAFLSKDMNKIYCMKEDKIYILDRKNPQKTRYIKLKAPFAPTRKIDIDNSEEKVAYFERIGEYPFKYYLSVYSFKQRKVIFRQYAGEFRDTIISDFDLAPSGRFIIYLRKGKMMRYDFPE